jgi:(p)ppGpp synthase/HD superfamily hydrolase
MPGRSSLVCCRCHHKSIDRACVPYHTEIKQNGVLYVITIANLKVARCWYCHSIILTEEARSQIQDYINQMREV